MRDRPFPQVDAILLEGFKHWPGLKQLGAHSVHGLHRAGAGYCHRPAGSWSTHGLPRLSLEDGEAAARLIRDHLGARRMRDVVHPAGGDIPPGWGGIRPHLCWQGKTFLQHQAEKAQALGSDTGAGTAPGRWCRTSTRSRGPLGRLHACFQAAAHPLCLALSVDFFSVSAEDPCPGWCRPSAARAGTQLLACCRGKWEPANRGRGGRAGQKISRS